MFDETWTWAGKFRISEVNLGVPVIQIQEAMINLCNDVKIWPKDSKEKIKENAIKLHHRLTQIHSFRDGNGRHARLLADIYLYYNYLKPFLWGIKLLNKQNEIRKKYLATLKAADKGNLAPLKKFAESSFKMSG